MTSSTEQTLTPAVEWDACMERDVGQFILLSLDENPPPEGSRIAEDLECWGHGLMSSGTDRLHDAVT